jgi:hypothetical protein
MIKKDVKSILIAFENRIFSLGDNCIRLDRMKYLKSFFPNTRIHINILYEKTNKLIDALLVNNPNVDGFSTSEWTDVDFNSYDIVFLGAQDEDALLELIHSKYIDIFDGTQFGVSVFSISKWIIDPQLNPRQAFPVYEELEKYINSCIVKQGGELYITEDEQKWGNRWLEAKGFKEGEGLVIVLDATLRFKLLNIEVYLEVLAFLLSKDNIKVLIFDESNRGKEQFYASWLSDEQMGKMIFSNGLKLREDLCIIGSNHTRLVFGPCTGLMHCASSIFNSYLKRGICSIDEVPRMICYTGTYLELVPNANFWWGNEPLVTCLLLKDVGNGPQVVLLDELPAEEKESYVQIPCSEYTAEMVIDFLK